jgi:hypothetical protein
MYLVKSIGKLREALRHFQAELHFCSSPQSCQVSVSDTWVNGVIQADDILRLQKQLKLSKLTFTSSHATKSHR